MDLPPDSVHFRIVGAGSAGCVLASRLSEKAARAVLIEAARDVTSCGDADGAISMVGTVIDRTSPSLAA